MQHLALGHLLDPRDVRDLDRGERLDVHLRMALLEPAEHLGVVARAGASDASPPTMWNSRVGVPRACSASANTWSSERVYAPSSFGIRAKEQKTQVFLRMQTLVGLMCWFAEKVTRSPCSAPVGGVGQGAEAEQIGRLEERNAVRRREALARRTLSAIGRSSGRASAPRRWDRTSSTCDYGGNDCLDYLVTLNEVKDHAQSLGGQGDTFAYAGSC